MILAIASGKGGTGKTTVAINMALSLADLPGPPPLFLDCDVEEPNAALFLNPRLEERRDIGQMIPRVDLSLCTFCRRCAEVCQYHAIAVISTKVLVFRELCHGCGSCTLNCPTGAISEVLDVLGMVERGQAGRIAFAHGEMDVGQAMATPIIRQLKQWAIPSMDGAVDRPVILDAPPGTACPVVETMRGADAVLLVTEPTPFGLHDLRLAVKVARDELGLPVYVLINREGVGDHGVDNFCAEQDIPIVMRIPIDRRIAEAYSEGIPLVDVFPEYKARFGDLYRRIQESTR